MNPTALRKDKYEMSKESFVAGFDRTYAQDLNGWREAEGMSRLGPLEIL